MATPPSMPNRPSAVGLASTNQPSTETRPAVVRHRSTSPRRETSSRPVAIDIPAGSARYGPLADDDAREDPPEARLEPRVVDIGARSWWNAVSEAGTVMIAGRLGEQDRHSQPPSSGDRGRRETAGTLRETAVPLRLACNADAMQVKPSGTARDTRIDPCATVPRSLTRPIRRKASQPTIRRLVRGSIIVGKSTVARRRPMRARSTALGRSVGGFASRLARRL